MLKHSRGDEEVFKAGIIRLSLCEKVAVSSSCFLEVLRNSKLFAPFLIFVALCLSVYHMKVN